MRSTRGIRGATTVSANEAEEILEATRELLERMVEENEVKPEDIASVLLTLTADLNAAFPAQAGRSLPHWEMVPLMCAQEIPVPGSLPRCIRVMMLVNTERSQDQIKHIYLREAVALRPDLAQT